MSLQGLVMTATLRNFVQKVRISTSDPVGARLYGALQVHYGTVPQISLHEPNTLNLPDGATCAHSDGPRGMEFRHGYRAESAISFRT